MNMTAGLIPSCATCSAVFYSQGSLFSIRAAIKRSKSREMSFGGQNHQNKTTLPHLIILDCEWAMSYWANAWCNTSSCPQQKTPTVSLAEKEGSRRKLGTQSKRETKLATNDCLFLDGFSGDLRSPSSRPNLWAVTAGSQEHLWFYLLLLHHHHLRLAGLREFRMSRRYTALDWLLLFNHDLSRVICGSALINDIFTKTFD